MASRWCFVEIAQAKALGKAIFPITISPCRVEDIQSDRTREEWREYFPEKPYQATFADLPVSPELTPAPNR